MARKKVALWYIRNDSAWRNALKMHTKILRKKASEVATMHNAKACVVVYGEGVVVPEVFPSHAKAVDILNQFRNMPKGAQLMKMMEQETKHLLYKALKSGHLLDNIEELTALGSMVDSILKSLGERTTKMSGQPPVYQARAQYVTNGMGMGPPMTYQAPPLQHEGCLDTVRSESAPATVIYNGKNNGAHDGNSAVFSSGYMNM